MMIRINFFFWVLNINNIIMFNFYTVTDVILCSNCIGCLGKRLGPGILGRRFESNVISGPLFLLKTVQFSVFFFPQLYSIHANLDY